MPRPASIRALASCLVILFGAVAALGDARPAKARPLTYKAQNWPRVTERAGAQCADALILAKGMFFSRSARLDTPISNAPGLKSRFSFYREKEDISGGGVVSDPAVFSSTGQLATEPTTFWQKSPGGTSRLLVVASPVGWRGSKYSIYAAPLMLNPDDVKVAIGSGREPAGVAVIAADRWNPPLVLTEPQTHVLWVIQPGEPYDALPEWDVYAPAGEGYSLRCRVLFGPRLVTPTALLPVAVRRLAASLDDALGPGRDEGTLRPTARIRVNEVGPQWANASLRPWAVADRAYNSRAAVDAGLRDWSVVNWRRRRVARQIEVQYAPAEAALAGYYRSTFGVSADAAKAAAAYVLDVMFRSYFVFPRNDVEPVRKPNPWPL